MVKISKIFKKNKNNLVRIGKNCRLVGDIDFGSEPYLIEIGDHVSITKSTFITHDGGVWVFRDEHPKIDVLKPIKIGNNVFIGANCIIMPGVTIEDNVVVGAGSIVTKSLKENCVYAGIPAKFIKTLDEYKEKSLRESLDTKHLKNEDKKLYLMKKFKL